MGIHWEKLVSCVRERMSTGDEILRNASGVCQRVKQALARFEEGELPENFDPSSSMSSFVSWHLM